MQRKTPPRTPPHRGLRHAFSALARRWRMPSDLGHQRPASQVSHLCQGTAPSQSPTNTPRSLKADSGPWQGTRGCFSRCGGGFPQSVFCPLLSVHGFLLTPVKKEESQILEIRQIEDVMLFQRHPRALLNKPSRPRPDTDTRA